MYVLAILVLSNGVLSTGRWVLMLDSDDLLAADFMKRVVTSLFKQNRNMINPGPINLIITDMGDLEGRYGHCCGRLSQ
jgi:hypothetical protein